MYVSTPEALLLIFDKQALLQWQFSCISPVHSCQSHCSMLFFTESLMPSSGPQIYWGLVLFAPDTTLVANLQKTMALRTRSFYITYPHVSFDQVTVLRMPWWWHCLTQFHNLLNLKIINCELSAILNLEARSRSMVCFIIWKLQQQKGFPGGSDGKASACNAGDPVWSLGWEDPLEKEKATHSSILAWKIPW